MESDNGDMPISIPATTTDVDATNESDHNAYRSAKELMLNEGQVKNREAIEDELFDEMESLCSQLSVHEGDIGITDEAQSKLNASMGAVDDAKNEEEKIDERYERLLKESAERERMLQMQINDKNELIKKLRTSWNEVGDRVVPAMLQRPELEHYLAVYDRNIKDKSRIRVTRTQLRQIDAFDKKMEEYKSLVRKMPDSKRYGWLKNSEKVLQIKCPNPVNLWAKVRDEHPHMFYGLKFVNKIKTEFEFLDEEELREKYNDDTFLTVRFALNLADEDDAIAKCLTPSDKVRERVCGLVMDMIEENKMEVEQKQTECGERVGNASDV